MQLNEGGWLGSSSERLRLVSNGHFVEVWVALKPPKESVCFFQLQIRKGDGEKERVNIFKICLIFTQQKMQHRKIHTYRHIYIYIHIHTFLHDMFPAWKNGVAMSQDRNLPSLSITRSAPWSWVWTPRRSARLYSNRSSAKKDHKLAEGEKQLVNVSKLGSGNKQIADPPNNKNCAFFFLGVWLELGRIHIIIFTNIYCK